MVCTYSSYRNFSYVERRNPVKSKVQYSCMEISLFLKTTYDLVQSIMQFKHKSYFKILLLEWFILLI